MEPELPKKTPDPLAPNPRSALPAERVLLVGLVLFALLVRGSVVWIMRGNLQQDPDAYREIAENLLRHGEFALGKPSGTGAGEVVTPTAYRPPLYPVVLSNLPMADGQHVSLLKLAGLHLLLGVSTVWLTYATTRRLLRSASGPEARQEIAPTVRSGIGDKKTVSLRSEGPTPGAETGVGPPGLSLAPVIAGFIVACDPILLNQQTLIMTETLAAFLAILSLWCLARFDVSRSWFNAALAGGAIGLAVLCRPTFLPWLGLVGVGMLLVRGGPNFKLQISNFRFENVVWRLTNLAAVVIAAGGVVSPWAIRNYRVFGKPIVTTTHGGYTLVLGNNLNFYEWLNSADADLPWSSGSLDVSIPVESFSRNWDDPESELESDHQHYKWAYFFIKQKPVRFLQACVYRLTQLWSPLPHKLAKDESTGRRTLRYATFAWYCSVYTLAAIGVSGLRCKLFRPPWIWGVLLCFAFTAVHTFYWTNLRMRAPLMPFVAMVAAAAIGSKFKVQGSKLDVEGPQ